MENDDDRMCMMRGCTEHDLLAARCRDCGDVFCQSHILRQSHACTRKLTSPPPAARAGATCPVCTQFIPVVSGASIDVVVARHIDAGCPTVVDPASSVPSAPSSVAAQRTNFCDFGDCRRNEATLIVCPACRGSFCVDHRHTEAHKCRAAKAMLNIRAPTKPATMSTPRGAASPSGAPRLFGSTAKPLSLTAGKLSNGDGDCIGVAVSVPAELGPDGVPARCHLRIATTVTLGRLLDAVCEHVGVRNVNNVVTTRAEDRLCLLATAKGAGPLALAPSTAVGSVPRPNGYGEAELALVTESIVAAHRQSSAVAAPPVTANGTAATEPRVAANVKADQCVVF